MNTARIKTVRMKVTPRPTSPGKSIDFFSCQDIEDDPAATVRSVQMGADAQKQDADYTLATELEYHAVRGARAWVLTDPEDHEADLEFKTALVRAGVLQTTEDRPLVISMTGEDDYTICVITGTDCYTINVLEATVSVAPVVKA